MARKALIEAKKKAAAEGRVFDETDFIIQLVESKRKEYEIAKQHMQQASILEFFQQIETSLGPSEVTGTVIEPSVSVSVSSSADPSLSLSSSLSLSPLI